MFKFIKQYAETISGVNVYPMISLLIFLVFFVVLLILVKKMKKERVTELSNIPFENDDLNNPEFAEFKVGSDDIAHAGSPGSLSSPKRTESGN